MPTLNWIGKEAVVNHDKEVPFRLLRKVKSSSVGNNSQNLVIHGDNLEALKALMPYYIGKIKCIYIDPPYNTGNESWIYNDKVNSPKIKKWLGKVVGGESADLSRHDKWLCMMCPRLKMLNQFLKNDGFIFISIDDNEQSNLRMLMDEIFGVENYLATFSWVRKNKGSFLSKKIRKMTEYVLCYQKQENSVSFFGEEAYSEKFQPLVKRTNQKKILIFSSKIIETTLKDGLYKKGFYGKPDTGISLIKDFIVEKGEIVTNFIVEGKFVWSQNFLDLEISKGTKIALSSKFGLNVLRYNQGEKIKTPSTLINSENNVGTNEDASLELSTIFEKEMGKTFNYSKPTSLIEYLIKMVTNNSKDEGDIILDSFAGSGTTGQATLSLNKKDKGNRKFILVEMEDEVAKEITAERIKRVIKKNKYEDGFEYCELDRPLFDEEGQIEETCEFNQFATYIYFTETQTNIDTNKIENNFIGEHSDTEFYLIYKEKDKNILTKSFLSKLRKTDIRKVVYADKNYLDEDTLSKYNIQFKQIPYEVKVY